MQNWYMAKGPHHLPGFGHFWTLAVEEQFYLVWPLVVFAFSQRRLLKVCASVAVFCLGLRIVLYATGTADGWAIRHFTVTRADTLLIGAALALMVRSERLAPWIRTKAVAVLAGGLAVMTAIYVIIGRTTFDDNGLVVTAGYSAIALAGAGLIALNLRKPFLNWAPLRVLGKYSYAIYVVHLPLSSPVRTAVASVITRPSLVVPGAVLVFAVTLALSLAAAMISWWLWESRWLALKERFARYETEPMPAAP
jgi:peptidoglycan/LPS O-acetylase OafA/YrhL